LSSKYYYEIERFNITSPVVKTRLLNVNNNKFSQKDVTNNELVVYMHQLYRLIGITPTGEADPNKVTKIKIREFGSTSTGDSDPGDYFIDKTNLNNVKRLN